MRYPSLQAVRPVVAEDLVVVLVGEGDRVLELELKACGGRRGGGKGFPMQALLADEGDDGAVFGDGLACPGDVAY